MSWVIANVLGRRVERSRCLDLKTAGVPESNVFRVEERRLVVVVRCLVVGSSKIPKGRQTPSRGRDLILRLLAGAYGYQQGLQSCKMSEQDVSI